LTLRLGHYVSSAYNTFQNEFLNSKKLKKMKQKKNFLASTIATVALATLALIGSTQAQQPGMKRTELQRHDLSVPGREVIQVRVDFDPGVPFIRHTHPGEEIIYVLEGVLEYQIEDKPPVTLKAGDVLFIPAGTIHAARNVSKSNAAELATYTVEKGKPLVTIVK
jgi:quercetin dioxygenase-like cupin family protein